MKMWIAREKDGSLYLYETKPKKSVDSFFGIASGCLNAWHFPEVTFENSPMEVELVLKKQI